MQRDRAAFVHAVVEHVARARIRQGKPHGGEFVVVGAHGVVDRHLSCVIRPQPLGVAGETLVEPDVAPVADAERIAEPLVRQLVRDQPLVAAQVVDAEDGQTVRLERDFQRLLVHDYLVVLKRVWPEDGFKVVQHCLLFV